MLGVCKCKHYDFVHHYGYKGKRGNCLALKCDCEGYEVRTDSGGTTAPDTD